MSFVKLGSQRKDDVHEVSARQWYVLAVLTVVYIFNIADRYVISTLIEPIKADLQLSDTAIGLLTGTALAIFYTVMGIPLGLIADRINRRNLVALAIGLWSIMTAICGISQTFIQLLLVRMGVGIGEAGGTPASQSMISDTFPANQRPLMTSIYALGAAVGSMIGSIGGGSISEVYGWRWAFFALALPGVLLAVVVRVTLAEPERGNFDGECNVTDVPTLRETLKFLWNQSALLHVLAGSAVVTFWGWGLLWWTPAFLARSYSMSTGAAGQLIGTISGIGGAVGIVAGAVLIHVIGKREPRWQAWLVAVATMVGTVVSVGAYATRSLSMTTLMLWLFVPTAYFNIGPMLALTQSLARPRMRGLICGLLLFVANIANLALAPQLIGIASDVANAHFGAGHESLRYALIGTTFTGVWAAYHWWAAGVRMTKDPWRPGMAEFHGKGSPCGQDAEQSVGEPLDDRVT